MTGALAFAGIAAPAVAGALPPAATGPGAVRFSLRPHVGVPGSGVDAPAVAATADWLSVASADALRALWYDDPSYPDKLAEVVPEVARRAHVDPGALALVWSVTDRRRMIVLLSALTQIGVPYRHYKMDVGKGFDCSGLTTWAWHQAGVELPRQSLRQIRAVPNVPVSATQPGDLLYYPGHVMLAIGVGTAVVHAPYTGRTVEVRPMMKNRANWLRVGSPI